ncbi:MAG TPA: hypothetical protein VK814_02180 [Acidobacteriaceae bacterium]|jgi:hypothetical protein|nr:hypothetical protein [Acidobacteriaceae bacterium]
MFESYDGERFCQTLPGQGWQVLVDWDCESLDLDAGDPRFTLEPVVAWATVKVERQSADKKRAWTPQIFVPIVRSTSSDELVLLDSTAHRFIKFTYLAPGEELADAHFALLKGGHRKGVEPRG